MKQGTSRIRISTQYAVVVVFFVFTIMVLGYAGTGAAASTSPKMKMTTDIPASIILPDTIETRIGRLQLIDGFPNDETVQKAYDFLLFQRGVNVFLDEMRAASMVALRNGHRELGIPGQWPDRTGGGKF